MLLHYAWRWHLYISLKHKCNWCCAKQLPFIKSCILKDKGIRFFFLNLFLKIPKDIHNFYMIWWNQTRRNTFHTIKNQAKNNLHSSLHARQLQLFLFKNNIKHLWLGLKMVLYLFVLFKLACINSQFLRSPLVQNIPSFKYLYSTKLR